ncbi:hypothetical protein QAD02_024249 [Eretmocerus hayati]|uniref:Uncharacterized protein n=1 Tax=Eretmocerus hayati TaxID=131215 RepID=A0ACC2PYV6_9HYME|nr:hypothetical protein QAD02_024249 [Eretmocerus hayati]
MWRKLRKLVTNCSYKIIKRGSRKPTKDELWANNRCQFLLNYIEHRDVLMISYDDWTVDLLAEQRQWGDSFDEEAEAAVPEAVQDVIDLTVDDSESEVIGLTLDE